MKHRYAFILALLLYGIISSAAFGQCTERTGRTGHVIFPAFSWQVDADSVYVYDPQGECVGRAKASYPEPFALTVWGHDDIAYQYQGKVGIHHGEQIRLAAKDHELEYNVALAYKDGPFYTTEPVYSSDMIAVAQSTSAILQTASAGFTQERIETDGEWTATLRLEADAPTGAVLLELRTSGDATVTGISPAADTYFSADTSAASYIGAGASTVNFQITGSGYGTLSIHRIRGTDRSGNLLDITLGTTSVAIAEPVFVVDLDGDGTLSDSDIRTLFLALVRDEEGQYPQADIFPFPQGDGVVDLLDFYYLNTANVTRRWPDGREVE